MEIRPHEGPQERFLGSAADIAIIGGAAGGGKSWALLLETLRHTPKNPAFAAVFFRRTTVQIRNPGGLWDQSMRLYPNVGARPSTQSLEWKWAEGGKVKLAHMEHENNKLDWHGAEIPLICCQEDERVRMADGSLRAVRDIRVGDRVMTLQGPKSVRFVGNRRLEPCVEATINGQERQVHSLSHKILSASGGWRSYLDICADLSRSSTLATIQSRARGICPERTQTTCRSAPRRPDSLLSGLGRAGGYGPQQQDRSDWSGSGADTGRRYGEIGCEASECGCQTLRRPASVAFSIVLHEPFPRLSARHHASSCIFAPDADACARFGSSVADCPDRCSAAQSLCGGPALLEADNGPGDVQRQDGVAAQSQTGWPLDDWDIAHKYNRRKLQYVHPYSGVELTATEDTVLGSCEMIPCGERWVIDLTIADVSHYITYTGVVNKNCFDELTTFTAGQFWYLLSRNRSMSGVSGYIRASCNPDADSWVAELIAWWIDQDSGLAIPERSGVIRWFIRHDDHLQWADTPGELVERYPGSMPKSLTFVGSVLSDNPTLEKMDPGYRASLMAMQRVDRERLLGGNWKIRPSAGQYFQRGWCEVIETAPAGMTIVRGWDLAATEYDGTNDPDWTAGCKMGRTADGRYVVLDHVSMRGSPHKVERLLWNTAAADGRTVEISLPQDPGQAGKAQVAALIKSLAGYTVRSSPESGDKITRFGPFSAQAEAGNVQVLRGAWNERFFTQLEGFPEGAHDDDADAASRAFNVLMSKSAVMRFTAEAVRRAAIPPGQQAPMTFGQRP